MPQGKYIYQAINQAGEKVSGKIVAESVENANIILTSRDLIPIQIKEQSTSDNLYWLKALSGTNKVKPAEMVLFTKQFHSMLVAGIPILRILSILEESDRKQRFKRSNTTNY